MGSGVMDKSTHVYCEDCVYGNKLWKHVLYNEKIPKPCITCWPYDMPDSASIKLRKNYVAKERYHG